MLEEHENQETSLQDLIDLVERDDLPTNEFTIQDKDPMVILGKLNEVIDYLKTLDATISSSDSKANEALQKAIQAVANAIEAVSTANTALSASNTALSTANTAISTANTALSSANSAVETAESAETKADTAITTANGAKTTAEGIDAKATQALANSQTALSTANNADSKSDSANTTANEANTKADNAVSVANSANTTANEANTKADNAVSTSNSASSTASTALTTANNADSKADSAVATAEDALNQVVAGLGTKVYRDTTLLSNLDIKPIEDDIANNTTAITALQNGKVDKVAGKQLSTEDFTTNEKNKLAGLNNYDDTQVQADITALQNGKANQSDLNTTNNNVATNTSNIATLNASVEQKADKNLSNVTYPSITAGSTTSGSGDRVVEQYLSSDGKTWYRKWASGWKECGFFVSGKKNTDIRVTTPITFSNTNYIIQMTNVWTSSGAHAGAWDPGGLMHKTTNSFIAAFTTWDSNAPTNVQCQVYCCGY